MIRRVSTSQLASCYEALLIRTSQPSFPVPIDVHPSIPLYAATSKDWIQQEARRVCPPLGWPSRMWMRHLSVSTMTGTVQQLNRRFDVGVKCSLKVTVCDGCGVEVVNGCMEEIVVEASTQHGDHQFPLSERLVCNAIEDTVEILDAAYDKNRLGIKRLKLKITIPERWCSLSIVSDGVSSVGIASVNEGTLAVSIRGDVTLGKIKGETTSINTRGGRLFAKSIYSNLKVMTEGGGVDIERLMCNRLNLSTIDPEEMLHGNVNIGSLYCHGVSSDREAKQRHYLFHLNIRDSMGRKRSMELVTGGKDRHGSVEVQLQDDARWLEISTRVSEVVLHLPPSLQAQIAYDTSAEVKVGKRAEGSFVEGKKDEEFSEKTKRVLLHARREEVAQSRSSPKGEEMGEGKEGEAIETNPEMRCEIDVTRSERIRLESRSWMEAAMKRMGKKK